MPPTVIIDGSTVTDLLDVSYSGEGSSELGTAQISVPNTEANRGAYAYGDEVEIRQSGRTEWSGFLSKKPTSNGGLDLTIHARDKRAILHNSEVHRPFYDMDPGEVIREAVEYRTDPRSPRLIFGGSDLTDTESSLPTFELADLSAHDLTEWGINLWFGLWNAGAEGSDYVRYDNVSPLAAPAGRVLWVETRFLVNNAGDYFSGELELRDDGGNNYVWDLEIPQGAEFVTRRFPVEEATDEGAELLTDCELEYRFEIDGDLPERRGMVIDYARIRPFSLDARPATLDTSGVENADRKITRRFDASVLEVIDTFATEDNAVSFVDDETLVYRPTGAEFSPVSLSYSSTRVTEATITRDASNITNQVTVQGAGNRQKTLRSSASIDYYGVSERAKPLIDTSIQSEAELVEWGEGYLNENAWKDTDMSFTVADPDYRDVQVGDTLLVEWPPEGISGLWTVSNVETDTAGFVTVHFTGSGA